LVEVWPVIDASRWDLAGEEPQGQRQHPWLRSEGVARTWLFKERVVEPGRPLHEDITEKIASELAGQLGIPAARVDLAQRHGARGCLVEDLRWSKGDDQPGQVLLAGVVNGYDPTDTERRGHNVINIHGALEGFGAPPNSVTPPDFTAFDVFAGYLPFDALIANGDRHDRNWAVLTPPPGQAGPNVLCGSYDHASSFGFNLSDDERSRRLTEGTIEAWARRGWARQFERQSGQPRQSLVRLARSATQLCALEVRDHWHNAVMSVQSDEVDALLEAAPGLSQVTRRFTKEVIMINRQRLLDAL
jgi:hypothetical protein